MRAAPPKKGRGEHTAWETQSEHRCRFCPELVFCCVFVIVFVFALVLPVLSVARARAGLPGFVVDVDVVMLCLPCAKPVVAVLESIERTEGGAGTSTARGRSSHLVSLPAAGATGTLADLLRAGRGAALATSPSTEKEDVVGVGCCDCSFAAGGGKGAACSGTAAVPPNSFSPFCSLFLLSSPLAGLRRGLPLTTTNPVGSGGSVTEPGAGHSWMEPARVEDASCTGGPHSQILQGCRTQGIPSTAA